jgi:hypothetical protein
MDVNCLSKISSPGDGNRSFAMWARQIGLERISILSRAFTDDAFEYDGKLA